MFHKIIRSTYFCSYPGQYLPRLHCPWQGQAGAGQVSGHFCSEILEKLEALSSLSAGGGLPDYCHHLLPVTENILARIRHKLYLNQTFNIDKY